MGRPGSGKTYLSQALAADLQLPRLDIADQPGHLTEPSLAWSSLRSQMTGPAIVESAGTSSFESRFWRGISRLVVVCSAPDEIRTARLQTRPEAKTEPGYVRRMLAIPQAHASGRLWSGTDPIHGPQYASLLGEIRDFMAVSEEAVFIGA